MTTTTDDTTPAPAPEPLATTPADAVPFVMLHPLIKIGPTATEVSIECAANEVHTNVSQDETTVETFCGTYTSYKPEVWDITINAVQSFGTAGLWNLVRPLVGQTVPFKLVPDRSAAVAPGNPMMSGTATVKAFPFLDGAIGEASEFDLVLAVQGVPTFATTGTP